jgi:selenocysteine lyase/cysteine desulfurase
MEWRKNVDHECSVSVDHFKSKQARDLEAETRTQVARLMHTEIDQVFLTTSCSAGLQSFLFKVPKNYKFLLLKDDYPALTQMVEDHHFEFTEVSLLSNVEEAVLEELRNNKYEVFALSAVQYNSGLLFDMEFLKVIKKEFPSLIILVDGTQFVGAEPFNFNTSAVDGIFVSGYKWLLAGHGNGFMCLKKDLLSSLNLTSEDIIELLDRGHKSSLAIGSLGFALKERMSFDLEVLHKKKKKLTEYFFEALKNRNLLEPFVSDRKAHSSIFTLKINPTVYEFLLKENIRCIQRGIGVRVSVHFYNTQAEVDHLLKVLDQAIK